MTKYSFIKKEDNGTWSVAASGSMLRLSNHTSYADAQNKLYSSLTHAEEWEMLNINSRTSVLKLAEIIPGGKGADLNLSEIPKEELVEGLKVESEHSSNPDIQKEIVSDHEAESLEMTGKAEYYKYLKDMEDKMAKNSR
jgi:hypothetical protein